MGVSCPATGTCTGVGFSTNTATGIEAPLAEVRSGGHWSVEPTPGPVTSGVDQLTAVSCLSAASCTAFGTHSSAVGFETLIEHWDGVSWAIEPSPNPAGSADTELTAGSCTSPTSCTAVGLYDAGAGRRTHVAPLAEHWNGSTWAIQQVPLPAGARAGFLTGVSCVSVTRCTAVGDVPFAAVWNGVRWTVQAVPVPAGAFNTTLNAVSCRPAGGCTAVGQFLNGNVLEPLAERSNGQAWSIQADAAPAGSILESVSCTSGGCTAVGQDDSYGRPPVGVAEHWDGTNWTLQPVPLPPHAHHHLALPGVSCRFASSCTAVGSYGPARPLAEHD